MAETPQEKTALAVQITNETQSYLTKIIPLGDGIEYSQQRLVRRIKLFESQTYPTGKFDKQNNYKYYYDIISPRVEAEIKNIDFDTKDIEAYSSRKIDAIPNLIVNLKITEWLRENGQAEELNSAIEEGSAWGNVLWKKVGKTYERADLKNVYVINQTAKTVNDTPIIEHHQLTQSDLRKKIGVYENVEKVISECASKSYKESSGQTPQETTSPYYNIYERNGEVKLSDLKEKRGEQVHQGDETKYVLARVIAAGVEDTQGIPTIKFIMSGG